MEHNIKIKVMVGKNEGNEEKDSIVMLDSGDHINPLISIINIIRSNKQDGLENQSEAMQENNFQSYLAKSGNIKALSEFDASKFSIKTIDGYHYITFPHNYLGVPTEEIEKFIDTAQERLRNNMESLTESNKKPGFRYYPITSFALDSMGFKEPEAYFEKCKGYIESELKKDGITDLDIKFSQKTIFIGLKDSSSVDMHKLNEIKEAILAKKVFDENSPNLQETKQEIKEASTTTQDKNDDKAEHIKQDRRSSYDKFMDKSQEILKDTRRKRRDSGAKNAKELSIFTGNGIKEFFLSRVNDIRNVNISKLVNIKAESAKNMSSSEADPDFAALQIQAVKESKLKKMPGKDNFEKASIIVEKTSFKNNADQSKLADATRYPVIGLNYLRKKIFSLIDNNDEAVTPVTSKRKQAAKWVVSAALLPFELAAKVVQDSSRAVTTGISKVADWGKNLIKKLKGNKHKEQAENSSIKPSKEHKSSEIQPGNLTPQEPHITKIKMGEHRNKRDGGISHP